MSTKELEALFEDVKNWGKWGDNDERGALNYITPARVAAAASLVGSGLFRVRGWVQHGLRFLYPPVVARGNLGGREWEFRSEPSTRGRNAGLLPRNGERSPDCLIPYADV